MPRKLKDWLTTYLDYTSTSESPEIFHFWTGVSTIAGALRRRVWIDQRFFEWTPNFYIIFVAPAGVVSKSTTIRYGIQLLRELEDIHLGPDSATWQAIGRALMEAQELVPLHNGDLNGEMEQMACITCAPSELGTFLDFQDRKLVDTLTALWDGQRESFEHSTVSQGKILIQNPWINIISATTPSWLKKNVPEEAIGGGFASRVVFVFAHKKRHLVAYPGLASSQTAHDELRSKLIHDLKEISQLIGSMILTPEAILWGQSWYEKHWDERPVHLASERFSGYIARKQTHIHKLAMVLSASRRSNLIIDQSELEEAAIVTSAMEQDMMNVFESIGVAPTSRLLHELMHFISTYQAQGIPVNQQILWRHAMTMMSAQEFTEAINAGISAGYMRMQSVQGQDLYFVVPKEKENNADGTPTS